MLLALLLAAAPSIQTLAAPPPTTPPTAPLVFWRETRTAPRPLHLSILRVDLRAKQVVPVALIAPATDAGTGAEALLTNPETLADAPGILAAVNANAFDEVPPPPKGGTSWWREHTPVDIEGWAKSEARQASTPLSVCTNFWVDLSGHAHIGLLKAPVDSTMAVAGYHPLVLNGELVDTTAEAFHPRTAIGIDREGLTLWLVVVDGRRAGVSEGMSTGELAVVLKSLGAWDAMNFDGGGSSVMLLSQDGARPRIVNQPSGFAARPLPVMLGLRVVAQSTVPTR